ncbi:MAG: AraC family transcriptional regulator [Chitinophagaceae bacterium]|nr:AraC family transcriptional regulator [Chitinophagaceae bacterium]
MKSYYKYLPITNTEREWGFYVNTVGYSITNPREAYPPANDHPSPHQFTWNKGRILDGYYLVFISKGSGTFESALTAPKTISEGTCFLLYPNVWHRYKPDLNTGWEEYWVGFNGLYPTHIMKNIFKNPENPFFEIGLNEPFLVIFQRLLDTVRNGLPGYHQVVSGITLEMLAMLYNISTHKHQSQNKDLQLIHKAKFLLRESLEQSIDIPKMVRELPMGYSKFRKLFKEETGISPHQYYLNLRINRAKLLLQTTELNINEIAYHSGFESEYYFSKFFKKKVSLSPTEFRLQKKQIK